MSASGARAKPRLALIVQYAVAADALPKPAALRRWARAALERDAVVAMRFVGARESRALNARYRGKDAPTNVLTFVYDDAMPLSGDLVLCAPVLRSEARAQGKRLADHCAHLVVHGMLHLQGYDHASSRDARAMEQRERALLARFDIADPYAAPER